MNECELWAVMNMGEKQPAFLDWAGLTAINSFPNV
jgi:hypothetical protein